MKSSKTMQLISVKTSYERQGKAVVCIKPEIDSRDGNPNTIKSRLIPTPEWADLVIHPTTSRQKIYGIISEVDPMVILVDEAQFLSTKNVEDLRFFSKICPVICYGLRADFKGELFEGSKRLFELADVIEEIKNVCFKCNRKATFNLRHDPHGPQIVLGDDEYSPACWEHWHEHMKENGWIDHES